MGHTGRQSRIDDRLAVDHGLLLHNTECFAVCRGGQHEDVTVRKGCPQIGFFQIPEEMHLCRHVSGFCDLVQLFFHFRRAVPHEEQFAALHLCKRMQQNRPTNSTRTVSGSCWICRRMGLRSTLRYACTSMP